MDAPAFDGLCQTHRGALVAYAFACCCDPHIAEDIVQESLAIACAKYEQPLDDPAAWLFGIVRKVWFRERARRRLAERVSDFVHQHAMVLFAPEEYDEGFERERLALSRCLERIGEIDRGLVFEYFAGGRTYPDIAIRLGRTLSWVKVRMFRVRAALLECVQKRLDQEDRR